MTAVAEPRREWLKVSEMKSDEMRTMLLKPLADSGYQWMDLHFEIAGSGDIGQLVSDLAYPLRMVLVLPAESVLLRRVSFEEAERKLLSQTVPYSLEPDISEDIEQLHFALGAPGSDGVDVAVVNKSKLERWLRLLQASEMECVAVVPEQLTVPWIAGTWTIVQQQQTYLVRYDECGGFAIHRSQLEIALNMLLEEQASQSKPLPSQLTVYAPSAGQQELRDLLPSKLKDLCEWKTLDHAKTSGGSDGWAWGSDWKEQCPLNLLQGQFLPPLPWRKWWQQSRAVAALAVLAVSLHLIYGLAQNYSLRQDVITLHNRAEQTYRQIIPQGKLVDPEKQLQRKVNALRDDAGSRFISMYRGVAEVLWGTEGVRMQSMSFSSKQSEIRMTLVAPSFNDIETLLSQIEQQQVTAELSGISNEQGKTRARLVIKG